MSDFNQKHEELMTRWALKDFHKGKEFIKDGVIDPKRWETADRKILPFLKKAYGFDGDLCHLIREEWKGPKYKMWWTVSYWLYALRKISGNTVPAFPKKNILTNAKSFCFRQPW